jgi:YebC/PmpR family DNA-binding regulatory protein
MGRHFEVRAASMAATAKQKSAIYMRASKEIYMAAKRGIPDPSANLALRSAIEKYRKSCPRDVIDRAVKKAQGGDATNYIEGTYEAFGPCGSLLIVETLTDNSNRALVNVRTIITRKGGHLGSVGYNFENAGLLDFEYSGEKADLEDNLILGDVDVKEISLEDGIAEIVVNPSDFDKAKEILTGMGITDFEVAQVTKIANERISLEGEELTRFKELLSQLDECEDVQAVYHNVDL